MKFDIERHSKKQIILVIIFLIAGINLQAINIDNDYSLRVVDYQQGLSNSAVLCIHQDEEGLMWFGTYDGVNCYDGKDMEVLRTDFSKQNTLNNNVIYSIQRADSSCLWITTSLGINRFSKSSKSVVGYYDDWKKGIQLYSNTSGNTWVIGEEGLYYYNLFHKRFINLKRPDFSLDRMADRAFVMEDGSLWTFPHGTGKCYQFSLNTFDTDSLATQLSVTTVDFHTKAIEYIFHQDGVCSFVDQDKDLYVYDIGRKSKIYIRNIADLLAKYGSLKCIIPFYEDIIVAFWTNGVVRLRTFRQYEAEIVNRNIRVYDVFQDMKQGILWIASDGQGIWMYTKKYSIAKNLMLAQLSPNLTRQIRSVMTDKYGGLWFGTKGDGLVYVPEYQNNEEYNRAQVHSLLGTQYTASYKKWNKEFQAYDLKQSRYRDTFWIGTGLPGLCYYSFTDKKLHEVEGADKHLNAEVHEIFEESDSVLYLATSDKGFVKVLLEKNGKVSIKNSHFYSFYNEQQDINSFFSICAEGDSILWLGSRKQGLVRFDKRTDEYMVLSLKKQLQKSVDDILSLLYACDGNIYVGTTSGLVCIEFKNRILEARYIGKEQGLFNDMIHGLLEDANGLLWLSTNKGLIKFNPQNNTSHTYYYTAGVQVGEFSDDAYHRCNYTGRLFFGGIDGLLYLDKEVTVAPEYYPNIIVRKMMVGRQEVDMGKYYREEDRTLSLKGSDLSFSFTFVAPDYVTGADIEYSYILEGYDKEWTRFSSANNAVYTDVPSGDYLFKVRYKKDVFDTEYKVGAVTLRILPPWYLTTWACLLYGLLALLIIGYGGYVLYRHIQRERLRQRLISLEGKEEDNSELTRELLNRLMIIYRSCTELQTENLPYERRWEVVERIREMVLAALFRPGTLKVDELKTFFPMHYTISALMNVSELSQDVINVLEHQGVNLSKLQVEVSDTLVFPLYKNASRCILYYAYQRLVSGATVSLHEEKNRLIIRFVASADLLKPLYEDFIKTEYVISEFPDVEKLGELQTVWQIAQSACSALRQFGANVQYEEQHSHAILTITLKPAVLVTDNKQEKKTILLLEDRDEMVWLISDLLGPEFNLHQVKSIHSALEVLHQAPPALWLLDMQMYAEANEELMTLLNRHRTLLQKTIFVPMLSWETNLSIQRDLLLNADSYIVLPYDILFLREAVLRAIHGQKTIQDIYLDDLLGEFSNQIVCKNEEQAAFIRRMLQIVEQNLDNEKLGTTLIAENMAMSSRGFYRRFKEITDMPPTDLIKTYRLLKAAKMLRNEELSIQEIISEVGISSRSYFYKEFAARYGMTPKEYREQSEPE